MAKGKQAKRPAKPTKPKPRTTAPKRRLLAEPELGGSQIVGVQPKSPFVLLPAALEHVVVIIQENRSFDQYFGLLPGVRGFYDQSSVFAQVDPSLSIEDPIVRPFEIDPTMSPGSIKHGWDDMHGAWNDGKLDRWLYAHSLAEVTTPPPIATMGYYAPDAIGYHTALAKSFTLCDHYFQGVLSSTASNRAMLMSGSIDAQGTYEHGPLTGDPPGPSTAATQVYEWTSYPQQLYDAKYYDFAIYEEDAASQPGSAGKQWTMNIAAYFKGWSAMKTDSKAKGRPVSRTGTSDFETDCANDTLPKVTWIIPPYHYSEHPDYSPLAGEYWLAKKIGTVLEHRWADTAVIVTYDECGACFDHVPPPVPPKTATTEWIGKGEYIHQNAGPGFRVPCLLISPWSVGGRVASQMYDHTSVLQFLGTFTGFAPANVSAWRKATFGNLMTAFDFASPAVATPPSLPRAPKASWSTTGTIGMPKRPQKWPP